MGDPQDNDYWAHREEMEADMAAEVEACMDAEAQYQAYLESTKQAEVRYDARKAFPPRTIRTTGAL